MIEHLTEDKVYSSIRDAFLDEPAVGSTLKLDNYDDHLYFVIGVERLGHGMANKVLIGRFDITEACICQKFVLKVNESTPIRRALISDTSRMKTIMPMLLFYQVRYYGRFLDSNRNDSWSAVF